MKQKSYFRYQKHFLTCFATHLQEIRKQEVEENKRKSQKGNSLERADMRSRTRLASTLNHHDEEATDEHEKAMNRKRRESFSKLVIDSFYSYLANHQISYPCNFLILITQNPLADAFLREYHFGSNNQCRGRQYYHHRLHRSLRFYL
jgi:hypothetical protein